jgi:hypothetical protein
VTSTFAGHHSTRLLSVRISARTNTQNSSHTTQDLKRVIKDEIALLNQDQNLLYRVFDDFVDDLRQGTLCQGSHFHELSTINNKTAFCVYKIGVFHFNVLQLLNRLSHKKMCPSALCHPVFSRCILYADLYLNGPDL